MWEAEGKIRLLVRVLKNPLEPTDPTGIIYSGQSDDGLFFTMDPSPAIAAGPEEIDAGGVEDPAVVIGSEPHLLVFYTGVDSKRAQGSLLAASGPDLTRLTKDKVLLTAPEGEGNIKEATVAQGPTAAGECSTNTRATAPRALGWRSWTGSILARRGEPPVMFCNGATADARWRIGWIAFDENYTPVVDRCIEPLLVPPPPKERAGIDIAFAASCLDRAPDILLYFSLEDRLLRRATVRRLRPA